MEVKVTDAMLAQLRALRQQPKFLNLPGQPAAEERRRLEPLINDLLDRLLTGIEANPQKSWVLSQMNPTVAAFYLEDTEARDPCVDYLEQTLVILGIPGADGAFQKYLIFF